MTDIIDSANDQRDRELEMRIAAARARSSKAPVATDECANECGEAPRPGSRYCCAECRDEDERRQMIRRKQGVR